MIDRINLSYVKFHTKNIVNKALSLINSFDVQSKDYNLDSIMEFNNAAAIYKKSKHKEFDYKINSIGKYTNQVFKEMISNGIEEKYLSVTNRNRYEFWFYLNRYINNDNTINKDYFYVFIKENIISLHHLLSHKNIVNLYGDQLVSHMLNNSLESGDILIDYYELKNNSRRNVYIPKSLKKKDKESIIQGYVNQATKYQYSYLCILSKMLNDDLYINDETRLQAKRKSKEFEKDIFNENSAFKSGINVAIKKQKETVISSEKDSIISYSYNQDWIDNNLDYNTLLNNLIYVFEHVDDNYRFTIVSNYVDLGVFERTMGVHSKKEFESGIVFNTKNMKAMLDISVYYDHLSSKEIYLEKVFKWFFEEYLEEELNVEGFILNIPSEDSSYLEKCRHLLPELEHILFQYNSYVSKGYVDAELIELSHNELKFEDAKTLIENKYYYPKGGDYIKLTYLMFSDQSPLAYIKNIEGDSLCELLLKNKLSINDIQEYNDERFKWLIDIGFVGLTPEGVLYLDKVDQLLVLKELYQNEVIDYHNLSELKAHALDELQKKGYIECKSSLLSSKECDVLDFYLNRRKFDNGFNIRNNYLHGNTPRKKDVEYHKYNYALILLFIALIIIKINDELCYVDDMKKSKRELN
jgi:hypothetical protein